MLCSSSEEDVGAHKCILYFPISFLTLHLIKRMNNFILTLLFQYTHIRFGVNLLQLNSYKSTQ
jgi:hypothetical protein